MKALVLDAGPIISLTMNNLLWILEPLRQKFGGQFLITGEVRNEVVEKPLTIKRFQFEAIQVQGLIDCGTLSIAKTAQGGRDTERILAAANECFSTHVNFIS